MIWFTSDWRLGDPTVIKKFNRPFKTTDEMDSVIVNNFKETIQTGDTVWFLGNFNYGNEYMTDDYFSLLSPNFYNNFKLFFVLGGEDEHPNNLKMLFDKLFRSYTEVIIESKRVILCPYPLKTWNDEEVGSYHLHGHHPLFEDYNDELSLDVSVDANNFYPVSWKDVQYKLETPVEEIKFRNRNACAK